MTADSDTHHDFTLSGVLVASWRLQCLTQVPVQPKKRKKSQTSLASYQVLKFNPFLLLLTLRPRIRPGSWGRSKQQPSLDTSLLLFAPQEIACDARSLHVLLAGLPRRQLEDSHDCQHLPRTS